MFSLHVPNLELPSFYNEDEQHIEDSVCWKLSMLCWRLLTREQARRVPRFLLTALASREQILAKENEPFNPVVCSYCKVWLLDPGCAVLHKQCDLVCWRARHPFWNKPRLTDFSNRNYHVLGLANAELRLRPVIYWRHAIMQILQHKFTILLYTVALHECGCDPLLNPNAAKALSLEHVRIRILQFIVSPFGKHSPPPRHIADRKLSAMARLCDTITYVKHN